ncbi:hypothetical protein DM02DRAFT_554302 [Periconia macrospinosa]|uniref:Zn(2)-C6 fungal-type domain-containing protein n=1 Tax=Periconia macrospinosa TaxID=97972 RepID=A0A2V1E500_9PLEO|nr:hypothetical protein DM02DRAFT_554302 [Periconia macrospinosa]
MASDTGRRRKRVEYDNHEPPSRGKRIRVSQACNECRKKKERCDGVHPRCTPCANSNKNCFFDAQTRRRGLPTGYVRAVEILLGVLLQAIDGLDKCAIAILRGEKSLPSGIGEQPSPSLVSSLAESWRRSETMKELVETLARLDSGDEFELSTRDLYDKLEGAFMNRLVVDNNNNGRIELTSPHRTTSPSAYDQVESSIAPEFPIASPIVHRREQIPLLQIRAEPEPLLHIRDQPMKLPSEWSYLLDRFFTDTHAWFPIAPKHDVLRHAFCLANNDTGDQVCLISNGERAALFAMLAYSSYRDTLSHRQLRVSEQVQHDPAAFQLSRNLQNEATSILARSEQQVEYDPGHVQALLVLTILRIDQGDLLQAWITIGRAVYAAALLNIIPAQTGNARPDDKHKRLFLGVFVLETMLAYNLGHRPYLRRSDLAKVGPLPVDSIEEWEAWRPLNPSFNPPTRKTTHIPGRSLSTFNSFLELVTILNDQAHGVCNLAQTKENFQAWKTTLPPPHRDANSTLETANNDTPPQTLNLALASISVETLFQIKSDCIQKGSSNPAITAAHQTLNAITRYKRVVNAFQAFPLTTLYLNILKTQANILDPPPTSNDIQQFAVPANRSTIQPNDERSLDYLQIPTPTSLTLQTPHATVPNTTDRSEQIEGSNSARAFDDIENHGHTNLVQDGSLFDSLSFLDTTDCSHQSGQFLRNLGIFSEIAPFDIEALFAPQ